MLAEVLSEYAHFGQKDKAGVAYYLHPRAVAAKLTEEDDMVVASSNGSTELKNCLSSTRAT